MKAEILPFSPDTEFYIKERCYIIEYSNSDNDSDLSIAQARVEPGVTTAWHYLDGVTERYVIISGTGRVEVGDLDPRDVSYGDTVIIPPNVRQRITNTSDSENLIFLALCTPRFDDAIYESLEDEGE